MFLSSWEISRLVPVVRWKRPPLGLSEDSHSQRIDSSPQRSPPLSSSSSVSSPPLHTLCDGHRAAGLGFIDHCLASSVWMAWPPP